MGSKGKSTITRAEPAPALPVEDFPEATKRRREAGKERRKDVPRSAQAEWSPPESRTDPVQILEAQAAERIPELVPIRYGRMLASPFAFFRGGAAIMASDLSLTPTTEIRVQACGDAHLENFGLFAAPDREMVFDLNDFDETLPASFEWDVKRLAASVVIAARDREFDQADCLAAARESVRAYKDLMTAFAGMKILDLWYSRIPAAQIEAAFEHVGDERRAKRTRKMLKKAARKNNLGALKRFAEQVDGRWQIKEDPPLVERVPVDSMPGGEERIRQALSEYAETLSPDKRVVLQRYEYADVARKVVGVGSVGTMALMLLMTGDREDDPLFLQLKQATQSVLAPFAGASDYSHAGERVVRGQRLTQAASDQFLGWVTGTLGFGLEYYVRQLRDMKGSAVVEAMEPDDLALYARLCGICLAHGHARSGDAAELSGYMGTSDTFTEAVTAFADSYADQNERDFAALQEAERDGRIAVESGV